MKLLHTADWHIGKTLYKHSLREEIELFFAWLLDIIDRENIDVLLVAGDIFDLANPSNVDQQLYYQLLNKLKDKNVQCVITAGNHDSPSLLEGPKELLEALQIHVVGFGDNPENQVLRLYNRDKSEEIVILATPYLRDSYVRKVQSGESYQSRVDGLKQGIINHYHKLKELAAEKHPGLLKVAMGHLYLQGASLSDSERDIQIGNQAGLDKSHLTDLFDYMALGHVHRPQKFNENGTVRYSGSPIALSFSERSDEKQVVIIDCTDDTCQSRILKISCFRALKRISGTLDQVKTALLQYRSKNALPTLIEIYVKEQERDQSKVLETIALAELESPHYIIVNYKIEFAEKLQGLEEDGLTKRIDELTPREVLENRIEQEDINEKIKQEVFIAFDEVLDLVKEDL